MRIEPLTSLRPRPPQDVAAMALVAQANALQLQVASNKRFGRDDPPVPSPGAVGRYREALIDWRLIRDYSDAELLLRTYEVWGQYCLFCWLFGGQDPLRPPDFARLPAGMPSRCPVELGNKLLEIERGLWRLRFEDRLRHLPELRSSPDFRQEYEAALQIPMLVFGRNVRTCSDDDLLACTCQYAGMLAAARWVADDRWDWGQAGIMELGAQPAGCPPHEKQR
jgi:hypothetical protein